MKTSIRLMANIGLALLLALAGSGCTKKMQAARLIKNADAEFDRGQYDVAEINYLRALQISGGNARAIGRLGIIYFNEGRLPRALPYLARACQVITNDPALRIKLGAVSAAAGKWSDARTQALWVLDNKPDDPEAPLLLAQCAVNSTNIQSVRSRLGKIAQTDDSAPIEIALGSLDFYDKNAALAEKHFEKAAALDPQSGEAFAALAELFQSQKDSTRAEAAWKKAVSLSPPRSLHPIQYARFKAQTGDMDGARAILKEVTDKAPDYFPVWKALAELALIEKNYDEVNRTLSKIMAKDSEDFEALTIDARMKVMQGKFDDAVKELDRVTKLYPQASRGFYQLAVAYIVQNQNSRALDCLKRATSLDPNFAEATLLMSQVQIKNGDSRAAIELLKPLAKKQPNDPVVQLSLASAYGMQNEFAPALDIYRKLENAHPNDERVPLAKGSVLARQRNFADATEAFERALRLAPEDLAPLQQIINLDLVQGNFNAAVQRVQSEIEKFPRRTDLKMLLSGIYMSSGDTAKAVKSLSDAIALEPDSKSALLLRSQVYFKAQDFEKALADLKTVTDSDPTNIVALMYTGITLSAKKDYSGARDAYEKLLQTNPDFPAALNNLSYLYAENLGDLNRAYSLAQHAAKLLPNDPSAADTLGWIQFRRGDYAVAANTLRDSATQLQNDPSAQFHFGMANYMLDREEVARMAFQRALLSTNDFAEKAECNRALSFLSMTADTTNVNALENRIAEKPEDPVALLRLADSYQRAGKIDRAITSYEAYVRRIPGNFNATAALARLYAATDKKRAYEYAKTAHNLNPGDGGISALLGNLAYFNGDYKWSWTLLQDCAQSQPDNGSIQFNLARSAYAVGKIPDAQAAMQKAVQAGLSTGEAADAKRFLELVPLMQDPAQCVAALPHAEDILKNQQDEVAALVVVALADEHLGNVPAAEETWEKILKRFPDFSPAQRRLAVLYAGDAATAKRAYTLGLKAREIYPDDPQLSKALGIILFGQGDYTRTISFMRQTTDALGTDPEAFYYIGLSQYRLNNKADSKTALQHALDLNLTGDKAGEAKRLLAQMKNGS